MIRTFKSSFSKVALLVSISLVLLAASQAIFVVRHYRSMTDDFSRKVSSALEKAAYEELVLRLSRSSLLTTPVTSVTSHGDEAIILNGTAIYNREIDSSDSPVEFKFSDSLLKTDKVSRIVTDSVIHLPPYDSLSTLDPSDITSIFIDKLSDSKRMTINMRGGSGTQYINVLRTTMLVDGIDRKGFKECDSLLAAKLTEAEIYQPYRFTLTIATKSPKDIFSTGEPIPSALEFTLPANTPGTLLYVLQIENPNRQFLKEMGWLILSSVAIVGLLIFSFVYLLRTLFRQKSIERMRIDFTHNITHELKTPISVAAAANEALLDFGAAADPERRRKYLETIDHQLGNLSSMVERILDLSLHEENQIELRPEIFFVEKLLASVVEEFVFKAPEGVLINVSVEPSLLTVKADPFHLKNIILNLLDNAVKYCETNPVIHIKAYKQKEWIKISVSDNGIGIPRSEAERVFEKFYRIPRGDLHQVKGHGLGLYHVSTIVARHGGTVELGSSPSGGTTFTIKLPAYEG